MEFVVGVRTDSGRGGEPNPTELAYRLLDCAKWDLIASGELYEAGAYALSVYHLQQASEKASKSFLTYIGYLDYSKMTRAGHDSMKLDKLTKAELVKEADSMEEILPGSRERIVKRPLLKEVMPPKVDIARATRDQILNFVLDIDEEKLLEPVRSSPNANIIQAEAITQSSVSYNDEIKALLHIEAISIVTSPHAESTRYPSRDRIALSPHEYTPESGIVKATPDLIVALWNALGIIDRIYQHEKKGPYDECTTVRTRPKSELPADEGKVRRLKLRRFDNE